MSEDDLNHLVKTLQQYYDVTVDYNGKEYVKKGLVHLSMAHYLKKALAQFQVEKPKKPVNSPYAYVPPKYGAKEQFAETDDSPAASKEDQTLVQKVTGKFNWHGRAKSKVGSTLLTPLSALASQQSKPTTKIMERVKQFLEYAATLEPAVLTFRKSGMVLAIHTAMPDI
jgi:FtsP/CotA-like multicopper oxidase with cupredoxin domain